MAVHRRPGGDDRGRHVVRPGVVLAVALVALVGLALGSGRARGLVLTGGAIVGAAVLLFPFVPTIASQSAAGLWSGIGQQDPWKVIRVSLGPAPGDWAPAAFLPVAALLGLALAGGERRGQAARAGVAGAAALALAWLSVTGYLPTWASNAPAYAVLAAVCMAFLVGDGLSLCARRHGASLVRVPTDRDAPVDGGARPGALVASDGGDGRDLGHRRPGQGACGVVRPRRLGQGLLQRGVARLDERAARSPRREATRPASSSRVRRR